MSRDASINKKPADSYRLGAFHVARMGYGAMQLERFRHSRSEAIALVRRAVDLGVNHIDTAQFYGDGFVNDVIREALRDGRGIVVATKVGADPNPTGRFSLKPAQRPEQLRASVEDNLRSLGVEQLAIVNLRRLDVAPGLIAQGDQIVDIDDQLAAMADLRNEGKVGAFGLSAVDLKGLRRAIPAGVACVQNAYSLVSRQFEDMLELCAGQGIAWAPFFPLGGNHFPEFPKVVDHPTVIQAAARLMVKPSQIGLAWLLTHKPNILLIPGTASLLHLEENFASTSIEFDEDTLAQLDAVYANAKELAGDGS